MAVSTVLAQIPIFQSCKAKNKVICRDKIVVTPKRRLPSLAVYSSLSDQFVLQIAETIEDSLATNSLYSSSLPAPLQKLREESSQILVSTSWPSRKDEPFRFTDTSFIRKSRILPIACPPTPSQPLVDISTSFFSLLVVDGYIASSGSILTNLPNGVFIGGLASLASDTIMNRVNNFVSNFEGDLFFSLNGIGSPDLIVVYVPEGCHLEKPLYLKYYSLEGTDEESWDLPISNPRVLVIVENEGEIDIIEEYMSGGGGKCYWANSVTEMIIGKGATVSHSYIQFQTGNAAHIKWTAVQQESGSTYKLVEASSGGKLSRHNVHVQQLGPDTSTELSTLHLCLNDQTQDLHSRIIFDHPRGYARQLHKCIVAHSLGQAVFDGNVKVNRDAQQTDAGQLTRSLILEPRATVNVKPNLQIIADDVKCSHGASISDLEENQLFYFNARGIDLDTARKALIFSFGTEVIHRFPHPLMRNKLESDIKQLLESALEASSR